MRRSAIVVIVAAFGLSVAVLFFGGCGASPDNTSNGTRAVPASSTHTAAANVQDVNLNDPVRPAASDQPIAIGAAQNEWTSFAIQISNLPKPTRKTSYTFKLHEPKLEDGKSSLDLSRFSADQVLPMPVDVNRAGFVRHTGLSVGNRPLPRALLPVPMDNGVVDLSTVRDPADPTNGYAHPNGNGEPLLFWVDLHVPPDAKPGEYAARCDLLGSDSTKPLASLPIRITIYNFVIPDERHLVMSARLEWEDLKRLYPEFETVTPKLINRKDDAYGGAVKVLDQLVKLAQEHRTQVVIPRLQPTVKWPPLRAGRRDKPSVDWSDLDTVLAPWLNGDAFGDKVPLGYWPLPAVDYLANYDRGSQLDYWANAATHFDQNEWLARTAAMIELPGATASGRAGAADSLELSAIAAQVLAAHPRLRVSLPLEDDQIQFASSANEKLLAPGTTDRVLSAAPGIVFASPLRNWPSDVKPPQHWLRTDVSGLVPYFGAGGDERDVRVWAWLAFLRQAGLIAWGDALPRTDSPNQPADPDDVVWFYPGSWFGLDQPVPTIQLKWLRRAQQDFEYLWLARQRGEAVNSILMARLITKPVQIQPNQMPDPTYGLMCVASDQSAWTEGQRLLARTILTKEPGQASDSPAQKALDLETLQWCEPQELPVLMGRTARWEIDNLANAVGAGAGANVAANPRWLRMSLGVDIYNATDAPVGQHLLGWSSVPNGWEVSPAATPLPPLEGYHVLRFPMEARFNLAAVDAPEHRPSEITFTNGYNNRTTNVKVVLPVSPSDRHKPGLKIDGELKDWDAIDSIHTGPLVRMFNRPALQKQELQFADGPSTIYTGWADENFYVAFNVNGVDISPIRSTRNFVDYQFGRAWGEDLCEILIQPIFADNSLGPVLHVVCKPTGQWVERKLDPRLYADPWQPFEGSGIRYAGRRDGDSWRGEVAIPWRAITDRAQGRPVLLRFNFAQHVHSTGQSATWAGPVDFGRDDSFMGLLYLREPNNPGMAGPAR